MTIISVNESLRNTLEHVSEMCFKMESILSLCMGGFIKNKISLIDEAKKMFSVVRDEEDELIKLLSNKAAESVDERKSMKSLTSIISHIGMSLDGMDSILQRVRVKVTEGILFSDKGANEICRLLRETFDILKTAGDTFLIKNEMLKKYVDDKYISLNEIVDAFSEEHEKRLIEGICQPISSSLYLNITDSLMKFVWHIKQAVDDLFVSR